MVTNLKRSACFDKFQTALGGKAKLADFIQRGGAPPKITRGGVTLDSCLSFHLKGRCFSTCQRAADHITRSAAEDLELETWAAGAVM